MAASLGPSEGLGTLRRGGSITELLFLYECATLEPTQLRPIAERLGLTVQAASHSCRQLTRRGYVEHREGHYRPTVRGVAWLHGTLVALGDDVRDRLARLHIVRSCRAIALSEFSVGDVATLELRDGLLSARPGATGPSRGRALVGARRGALVEIGQLEGIVPLTPGRVQVRTLSARDLGERRVVERLRHGLPDDAVILAAQGLESFHLLRRATARPIVRFAVAASCLEAARIGVSSMVVVLEEELPRLLSDFSGSTPPALEVTPLARSAR